MRLLAVLLLFGTAFAAPAPLQTIVNDATGECADFSAGDECVSCEIPAGWRSLGVDAECPEGYSAAAGPAKECTRARIDRCCSEGHSGAPGDCGDVEINRLLMRCRFGNGSEPWPGWEGKPDAVDDADWACPEGFSWEGEAAQPCIAGALLFAVAAFASRM